MQQGCPSYFKEDDKLYHTANGELRRAQTLQGTPRQDITRSALDKLVRVPLLALLSCMTLHIKALMYASSPPIFKIDVFQGTSLPAVCHPTACCDTGLQSCTLHSDRSTSSLSLCCLSVSKHAYRLQRIASPGSPDWIQGFSSVRKHLSASLEQTSLVSLCQPDLAANLHCAPFDEMQVAKTVDINHVSPLLAQLGAYDGMVTLALAKAKALDPEVVAAQKSEAGRLAREVICCCACSIVDVSV